MAATHSNPFIRTVLFGVNIPDGILGQKVLAELHRRLGAIMRPISLVTAFNALAIAVVFYNQVATWLLAAWVTPLLFFSIYQLSSAKRMNSRDPKKHWTPRFLKRGSRNTFIFGLWWSASCWLFATSNDTLNIGLVVAAVGMCAAAAACVGPATDMSSKFMMGCLPLTLASLFVYGNPITVMAVILGSALCAVLIYMSYLKYTDTVVMLKSEMELSQTYERMQSALNASGIGVEILTESGEEVFRNALFEEHGRGRHDSRITGTPLFHHGGKVFRDREDVTIYRDKITVLEDVTDFIRQQRELTQARKEAQDSADAKGRFINSVSSEFKNPLSTILGVTKIMGSQSKVVLSDEDRQSYLGAIEQAARDLDELIDNVIEYSKLENDVLLETEQFQNIDDIITRSISRAVQMTDLSERLQDLTITVNHSKVQNVAHPISIGRIVTNLLTNAMLYSQKGTPIQIKVDADEENALVIVIRDRGKGMSNSETELATTPFFQASKTLDRGKRGPGLGLSVTQRLISGLFGTFSIESRAGRGTNVAVRLPTAIRAEAPEPISRSALQGHG